MLHMLIFLMVKEKILISTRACDEICVRYFLFDTGAHFRLNGIDFLGILLLKEG